MVYNETDIIKFKQWIREKPSNVNKECHLRAHPYKNEPKFYASYEKNKIPTCMSNLLAHDYGRIWHEERKEYLKYHRMDKETSAKIRLLTAKERIKEIGIKGKKRIAEQNEIRRKKEPDYWLMQRTPIKNKSV